MTCDEGSVSCKGSSLARYVVVVLAAILVLIADQLSKVVVVREIHHGELRPVIDDFFNLTLTYNKGVAFGMFSTLPEDTRNLVLATVTVVALGVMTYLFSREHQGSALVRTALGMIFGGAVGNIADRLRLGQVVDFLDFYWRDYHWPAFNIADSAICVGVVVLILTQGRSRGDCMGECESRQKSEA